jgi:hypothetical protein
VGTSYVAGLPNVNQVPAVRIGEWEGPKEHSIDHGEDRRVGTGAEAERHRGDDRERGAATQAADA